MRASRASRPPMASVKQRRRPRTSARVRKRFSIRVTTTASVGRSSRVRAAGSGTSNSTALSRNLCPGRTPR